MSNYLNLLQEELKHDGYGETIVDLKSDGKDVYVISDLHLASGVEHDGKIAGTENFFADGAFERFLNHLNSTNKNSKILVINGDFIDFLRVVKIPTSEEDFESWKTELGAIGIDKSIVELKDSITKKEKVYGLKTFPFKSIWKIIASMSGHPRFFNALAHWLENSNQLVITKGNHDLELYWPEVRTYFRYHFARSISDNVENNLKNSVLPNLTFVDDILTFDDNTYITHGHIYDKYTNVIGKPTINNGTEINIPFGSFFNRYLINQVELSYPYVDNIRPAQNVLPMMLKEHFFTGLKLLFYHIPFTLKIIPKQYYKYMFSRFLIYVLAVGVPIGYTGYLLYQHFFSDANFELPKMIQTLVTLGFSYLFSRIVSFFHLSEPDYLDGIAKKLFKKHPKYKYFLMGHTHNPDVLELGNQKYFNTGTWIPIIEYDAAEVRHDKCYLFTHLKNDGHLISEPVIYFWNDDAGREEKYPLIRNKGN